MAGEGIEIDAKGREIECAVPRGLGTVQQHRRLIRYRISATDSTNSSIRTPYTDDPPQNFAYFVYDSIPAWSGAARPGTTTPVSYQPALLESVPPFHLITSTTEHARQPL